MENKENWFQRWKTKKRFWGSTAIAVGTLMQLIPIPALAPWGVFLIKAGSVLTAAGVIDKADRVKKEKKSLTESGSSDQK